MSAAEAWIRELEAPSGAFFAAFAARIRDPEGLRDGIREALRLLVPILDWQGGQPQASRSLLGVRAALVLRPHLEERRFLRLLALNFHGLAREPRAPESRALQGISKGSGQWGQVALAYEKALPSLAWGELQGLEGPEAAHFQALTELGRGDMASMGMKAVWAHQLGDLFERLEAPKATGRRLLGLAAWLGASAPQDRYWEQRIRKRLGDEPIQVSQGARPSPSEQAERVRELCGAGFVGTLNAACGWLRQGLGREAFLDLLVGAAAERLRDARRDLEGKTAGSLAYLAALAGHLGEFPEPWAQAAALVNFFPEEDPEARLQPVHPSSVSAELLREAILDAEPDRALGLALALPSESSLPALAEAVALNDPAFNQGFQAIGLAAAVDLLPHLPEARRVELLAALAKSLANSQGSGDLGDRAERALA